MEHWDHRVCEGLKVFGAHHAMLLPSIVGLLLIGAIGLGLI